MPPNPPPPPPPSLCCCYLLSGRLRSTRNGSCFSRATSRRQRVPHQAAGASASSTRISLKFSRLRGRPSGRSSQSFSWIRRGGASTTRSMCVRAYVCTLPFVFALKCAPLCVQEEPLWRVLSRFCAPAHRLRPARVTCSWGVQSIVRVVPCRPLEYFRLKIV